MSGQSATHGWWSGRESSSSPSNCRSSGSRGNPDIEVNKETGQIRPEGSTDEDWGQIDNYFVAQPQAPAFDVSAQLSAQAAMSVGLVIGRGGLLVLAAVPAPTQ